MSKHPDDPDAPKPEDAKAQSEKAPPPEQSQSPEESTQDRASQPQDPSSPNKKRSVPLAMALLVVLGLICLVVYMYVKANSEMKTVKSDLQIGNCVVWTYEGDKPKYKKVDCNQDEELAYMVAKHDFGYRDCLGTHVHYQREFKVARVIPVGKVNVCLRPVLFKNKCYVDKGSKIEPSDCIKGAYKVDGVQDYMKNMYCPGKTVPLTFEDHDAGIKYCMKEVA